MEKKTVKKKFSIKLLAAFIVFEIVFTGITGPLIVFYGPFNNLKKTVVGTAMATFSHQYIATTFLSKEKINEILNKDAGQPSSSDEQNIADIKIQDKHDKSIERYEINAKKFSGYLLVIKDPSRVKVGYTSKLGVEGQRTSQIAENNNAVAAINGGGFTDKSANNKLWSGIGSIPTGIVMSRGKIVYKDEGTRDDTEMDVVGLTDKGVLVVGNHSIKDLKKLGVTEAVSFGPALIINGKPQIKGDGSQGNNPRTAIGQRANGDILLLVLDGRQGLKPGATLREVQELMLQYEARNATNLDGGSSSTMYYNGEVINNPCDPLGERSIATAIIVEP